MFAHRPAAIPIATGKVVHLDWELLHLAQTAVHLVHECQVRRIICGIQTTYRINAWQL